MSIEELRRRDGGGAADGDEGAEEEEEEDEAFVFDQDAVDDETTMAEAEVGETSQDVQDEIKKLKERERNVYRGVTQTLRWW